MQTVISSKTQWPRPRMATIMQQMPRAMFARARWSGTAGQGRDTTSVPTEEGHPGQTDGIAAKVHPTDCITLEVPRVRLRRDTAGRKSTQHQAYTVAGITLTRTATTT